ncbi:MAG: hypothetical protein PVH19_15235 [Planctomycetia bacterium]|jgi:hypothetical protein
MKTKIFFGKTAAACFIGLMAVLLLLPGCSDGRPKRVKVSGTVLIDGKPLSGGFIRFYPEGGRTAWSDIDEQGRFTLSCFDKGDGVVPGTHPIAVTGTTQISQTTIKWNAPPKYAEPQTSGLKKTIDGPTDSLTIELTWKGDPKGRPFVQDVEANVE